MYQTPNSNQYTPYGSPMPNDPGGATPNTPYPAPGGAALGGTPLSLASMVPALGAPPSIGAAPAATSGAPSLEQRFAPVLNELMSLSQEFPELSEELQEIMKLLLTSLTGYVVSKGGNTSVQPRSVF